MEREPARASFDSGDDDDDEKDAAEIILINHHLDLASMWLASIMRVNIGNPQNHDGGKWIPDSF